jgi:uncharacterized protein (DUF2252 family)
MEAFDPARLAQRQLESDRERMARFPFLMDRKVARMSASPLAFLRGAAPLYYEMLKARPGLAAGPAGEGWLVGDSHLENFGAYRTGTLTHGDATDVAFNLNDFDDAILGPWRFDLLRLTTSLLLGGRELGLDGVRSIELCHHLLAAYVAAACEEARELPAAPPVVKSLLENAGTRSRKSLLDGRTEVSKGKRRFVRGDRYHDLPKAMEKGVAKAFELYAKRMDAEGRPTEEQMEIVDFALRIAGTGSLGGVRVGVLVRGKGGIDGGWVFDLKEQGTPSACVLLPEPKMDPAMRVLTAYRACVARPPGMLGTTELNGLPMYGRRLTPQEDKIELERLSASDLVPLAKYFGALLGASHARGATARPRKAWTDAEQEGVLERAIQMAAVHEAIYLHYCRAVSPPMPKGKGAGSKGTSVSPAHSKHKHANVHKADKDKKKKK